MSTQLRGLMQDDFQLNLHHIRRALRANRPEATVATLVQPDVVERTTYAQTADRVDRLARALGRPGIDERQAAALCYTSGTTGNPKGVLYSHRSISMHSTATMFRDGLGLSRSDRVLAVVPMFHANAWGLPHGAALAGADLVLPDRHLQAEPLAKLIAAERPTLMGCVPTIYSDLLRYADEHADVDLSSLRKAACGGSAVPRLLMKEFQERHGVHIFQAWGMTETSPLATYSR